MKRMQGFTLLEMLAAISLLSLLMVLVASSFKSSSLAVARTGAASARMEQVRAGQRFVRESVEDMRETRVFAGEPERMQYLAAMPLGLGAKLALHRLEFVRDPVGGWHLQVAFFDKDSGQAWGEPQVLVDRLHDVSLAYRGLDDMHRDSGWLPRWPWPQRLPRLVRVQARTEAGMPWPTLSMAVRIDQQIGGGQ